MDPKNQPAYPLLEALLYVKGLTLQATYTSADVASLFDVSVRTIQSRTADGGLPRSAARRGSSPAASRAPASSRPVSR